MKTFGFYICRTNDSGKDEGFDAWSHDKSFLIRLQEDKWDDWSYRTQFQAYLVKDNEEFFLGPVKILPRSIEGRSSASDHVFYYAIDHLPTRFDELSNSDYVSLGQTLGFYKELHDGLGKEAATLVATALADLSSLKQPPAWIDESRLLRKGWNDSLLRSEEAKRARDYGHLILEGVTGEDVAGHALKMTGELLINPKPSSADLYPWSVETDFFFSPSKYVPYRLHSIIGKNGSGKTSFLQKLALTFASNSQRKTFGESFECKRLVLISFNPFDAEMWQKTATKQTNSATKSVFKFHLDFARIDSAAPDGLLRSEEKQTNDNEEDWFRRLTETFPAQKYFEQFYSNLRISFDDGGALKRVFKLQTWHKFLEGAFDDETVLARLSTDSEDAMESMSAGQRALTQLYAFIFDHLDMADLLVIDEPENYLHPSLLSRFVRQLNLLLEDKRSFALLVTHSPIILQEIPARQVHIFAREEGRAAVYQPQFETFGESLETLTQYLFETDLRSSLWKQLVAKAIEAGELEELESALGNKLGMSARAYAEMHLALWKEKQE